MPYVVRTHSLTYTGKLGDYFPEPCETEPFPTYGYEFHRCKKCFAIYDGPDPGIPAKTPTPEGR